MFAIVVPVTLCPLAVVFKYYERKAIKMGVFKREPSGRSLVQSIVHYFHEFDGMLRNLPVLCFLADFVRFQLLVHSF